MEEKSRDKNKKKELHDTERKKGRRDERGKKRDGGV